MSTKDREAPMILAIFALVFALMNGLSYWAGMCDARKVDAIRARKEKT